MTGGRIPSDGERGFGLARLRVSWVDQMGPLVGRHRDPMAETIRITRTRGHPRDNRTKVIHLTSPNRIRAFLYRRYGL
jgi:hypothetical protein